MNDRKLYRWTRVSSLILFLMLASTFAFGNLIMQLDSSGGGKFTYHIGDSNAATFTISGTSPVSLTGLSGVTGATIVGGSTLTRCTAGSGPLISASSTSSSVTLSVAAGFACQFAAFFSIGSFVVDSAAPLHTVHYAIQADIGSFSGTVGGPTVVPEPSSLLMLGSGVLGLAWMVRRKITT
jgi:hypothetical protein